MKRRSFLAALGFAPLSAPISKMPTSEAAEQRPVTELDPPPFEDDQARACNLVLRSREGHLKIDRHGIHLFEG